MNVNFSGGAKKTPERATSPPRTLSFIRVSVRSWESFVDPGKRPRQPGRARAREARAHFVLYIELGVTSATIAESMQKRATCPPWTLSFLRVSVRSWETFADPGERP